jgi:hypothetical protein
MTKGGEGTSKGSNDSVFGDSCQRGRKYEPKANGPHHHPNFKIPNFKINDFQLDKNFKMGISLCSKGGASSIFKIDVLKLS